MSVSVIIPAYNEAPSIGAVLEGVASVVPGAEIVVVDDGSQDHTAQVALNLRNRITGLTKGYWLSTRRISIHSLMMRWPNA